MKRRGFLSFLGVGAGATLTAGVAQKASASPSSVKVPESAGASDEANPCNITFSAPSQTQSALPGDLVTHAGIATGRPNGDPILTVPADCRGAPYGSPHVIGIQAKDNYVLYDVHGPVEMNFQELPGFSEAGYPVYLRENGKVSVRPPRGSGDTVMQVGILARGGSKPLVHYQLQWITRRP